jgi:hypothetical protein
MLTTALATRRLATTTAARHTALTYSQSALRIPGLESCLAEPALMITNIQTDASDQEFDLDPNCIITAYIAHTPPHAPAAPALVAVPSVPYLSRSRSNDQWL